MDIEMEDVGDMDADLAAFEELYDEQFGEPEPPGPPSPPPSNPPTNQGGFTNRTQTTTSGFGSTQPRFGKKRKAENPGGGDVANKRPRFGPRPTGSAKKPRFGPRPTAPPASAPAPPPPAAAQGDAAAPPAPAARNPLAPKPLDRIERRQREPSPTRRLHLVPPVGTTIPVSFTENADRFHVKLLSEADMYSLRRDVREKLKNHGESLLAKSIEQLTDEINDEALFDKVVEEAAAEEVIDKQTTELWTTVYEPKRFIELISDPKINRNVLTWVKSWDHIVFNKGKELKKPEKKKIDAFKIGKVGEMLAERREINKGYLKRRDLEDKDASEFKRTIILAGPPGTGKSTLAHVVAEHCGYKPFEVNASDDRSGKKLREMLEAAATMQNVFVGEKRPNLIILDEVDGVDGDSAVKTILKLITGVKTKKRTVGPIKRPIICICNNQYKPALRPLKQHAEVFAFKPIRLGALNDRLKLISRRESINVDHRALSYLSEQSNCDIRSCLHTLQFVKSQSRNPHSLLSMRVSEDMLRRTNIGRKDITHNFFKSLEMIMFERKKRRDPNAEVKAESRTVAEWNEICGRCRGGDLEKLMRNVHEHYLENDYIDIVFGKTPNMAEWFTWMDILNKQVRQKQMFHLMGMLPYGLIAVKLDGQSRAYRRLQMSKAGWELRTAMKQNHGIVDSFIAPDMDGSTSVALARFANKTSVVTDYIPYISHILRPKLTADKLKIHPGLKNKSKKTGSQKLFARMINVCCDYGLSINPGGQELDPPIEYIQNFDSEAVMKSFEDRDPHVAQKLRHEINLEKIRRKERTWQGLSKKPQGLSKTPPSESAQMDMDELDEEAAAAKAKKEEYERRKAAIRAKLQGRSISGSQSPSLSNRRVFGTPKSTRPTILTPDRFGVGGKAPLTPVFGGNKHAKAAANAPPTQTQVTTQVRKNFLKKSKKHIVVAKVKECLIRFKFEEGCTNAVRRKTFCREWIG